MRSRRLLLPFAVLLLAGCAGSSPTPERGEPAAAPALPATEVANSAPDGPLSDAEAFRLLEQTTFGAQLADIEHAGRIGPESWINEQMQKPANFMLPLLRQYPSDRWNEHVNVWWRNAIKADDQLRQRVAFALSEIIVVSGRGGLGGEQEGMANFYDLLLRHSFGNFRDLLEEVTLSPMMGEYLSMKGNRRPDAQENVRPDENYARELLQLFTIGQVQLNEDGTPKLGDDGVPLPSYTQEDVEAFAHVFTGWHFANAEEFYWPKNKDYIHPMRLFPDYHDTGEKRLLNGLVLPADQSGEDDLHAALDNVFNHPNTGPFIVKQLIQRLVTSNPTPSYVRDVTHVFNRNSAGVRGSLASTVKAILMHSEARLGHLERPDEFGKLKEPLLRITQLWRAFEPDVIPAKFNYSWAGIELGQTPQNAPSVFNFFRPDFQEPGPISDRGLVTPEFEILDESAIVTLTSRLLGNSIWSHNYKNDTDSRYIAIDIRREMQLEPDPEALINHLDRLLLGGRMTEPMRNEVRSLMNSRTHANLASLRVTEAIFLILSSPEAAVQI